MQMTFGCRMQRLSDRIAKGIEIRASWMPGRIFVLLPSWQRTLWAILECMCSVHMNVCVSLAYVNKKEGIERERERERWCEIARTDAWTPGAWNWFSSRSECGAQTLTCALLINLATHSIVDFSRIQMLLCASVPCRTAVPLKCHLESTNWHKRTLRPRGSGPTFQLLSRLCLWKNRRRSPSWWTRTWCVPADICVCHLPPATFGRWQRYRYAYSNRYPGLDTNTPT